MDSNTRRKLQLAELSILKDVVAICDKYDITYYLSSGTLLGAVRHNGFIPWDDDIDICMPFQDYMNFLSFAKSELPNKYFVQTYKTDPNWNRPFTKIRLNNTAMFEKGFVNYHIHQGIWIDIFPLTGISSKISYRLKKYICIAANYCQAQDYIVNSIYSEFQEKLGKVGIRFLFLFYHLPMDFRIKLHDFLLKLVLTDTDNKYISELSANLEPLLPKKIFAGEPALLNFEGAEFKVPSGYEEYLTLYYGDYMTLPPINERVSHSATIIDFDNDYTSYIQK